MQNKFLTTVFLLFALSTMAQKTSYVQDTMKYLELNGTSKQYDQAVDQLFVMLKQQYATASIPDDVWADLKTVKPQELMKIKSLLVSAYRGNFSQEEVQEMIEFYDSPAGRQLVTDPTAMSQEQKDAYALFTGSETGKKITARKESLSRMVSEVSELWSRDLYKNITGKLQSKGYTM